MDSMIDLDVSSMYPHTLGPNEGATWIWSMFTENTVRFINSRWWSHNWAEIAEWCDAESIDTPSVFYLQLATEKQATYFQMRWG